jgi:hypothetical protein
MMRVREANMAKKTERGWGCELLQVKYRNRVHKRTHKRAHKSKGARGMDMGNINFLNVREDAFHNYAVTKERNCSFAGRAPLLEFIIAQIFTMLASNLALPSNFIRRPGNQETPPIFACPL